MRAKPAAPAVTCVPSVTSPLSRTSGILPVTGPSNMFTYVLVALVQWLFRKAPAPHLRSGSGIPAVRRSFLVLVIRGWKPPHRRAGVGSAFDAPPPHRLRRPGRARVFSEVARLQCDSLDLTLDLTDGSGQKRDLPSVRNNRTLLRSWCETSAACLHVGGLARLCRAGSPKL